MEEERNEEAGVMAAAPAVRWFGQRSLLLEGLASRVTVSGAGSSRVWR